MRQEWEYALSLNRANFIRPVYWEEPLPELREQGLPPAALKRLQFHRLIHGAAPHPQTAPDEADTERMEPRPATEQSVCGSCGTVETCRDTFLSLLRREGIASSYVVGLNPLNLTIQWLVLAHLSRLILRQCTLHPRRRPTRPRPATVNRIIRSLLSKVINRVIPAI